MSKVLARINAQIERDGATVEHQQVLKLYKRMVDCGLNSSMLWGLLTNCRFERYGVASYACHHVYSVKPEALMLLENWKNAK